MKSSIKYVRVAVWLDIPVAGNNGEDIPNDEGGEILAKEMAANYEMPEEYVCDSVEFVKFIRE